MDTVREIPVFKGTPEEVGTRYATVNKTIILDLFSLWLEGYQKLGLGESSLVGRASSFIEVAAEEAKELLTRKANEISRRAIGLMRMAGEKA